MFGSRATATPRQPTSTDFNSWLQFRTLNLRRNMWDPDAFARDEDVLSWRSFDTALSAEAYDGEAHADVVSETTSGAFALLYCVP